MQDDNEVVNAIEILRARIEAVHPQTNGDKTSLLAHIDAIEFGTLIFSSIEEKSGFNDFLGCFTDCHFDDYIQRLDWARGYLRASRNPYILNNRENNSDCHFNDAESIVKKALTDANPVIINS
ncbi:hypothetical protein KFE26_18020 [Shewanella sp. M16]|uniref:hypothetical protein n=1 Tax=Shewanella sp. M16 TaxID=2830837 RepID=UPI001BAF7002|nr:hypothetical protein [Shewanella sp. M16]MBS0044183.1 hypothetical protein [Shewanella sp. M16]